MNEQHRDLFARDGHLTMLSLDRYDVGELDPGQRHGIEIHVEHCERCRGRLAVVCDRSLSLTPPILAAAARSSTGSATVAYLTATAAVALAAGLVLGVGSALWPAPQAAREAPAESSHMASAYTSVAQEYNDADALELELERTQRDAAIVTTPVGDGWLGVYALDEMAAGGDTDGGGEATVAAVLWRGRASSDGVRVAVPRRFAERPLVAVLCPAPFLPEPGEVFAPEPDCAVRDQRP
ncbi:MAG: hypothetical protein U0168_05215 [Nannocystaceae bacterium]